VREQLSSKVASKFKSLLQQWEKEFASDSSLDLLASTLRSMRESVNLAQKEEDDLKKAIAESLKAVGVLLACLSSGS
jgi:hypothetical protein